MRNSVLQVRDYFRKFNYKPSFDELYTFLPKKISKKRLKDYIDRTNRNTLGGYSVSSNFRYQNSKIQSSTQKIEKVQTYFRLLSKLPQIRLVGLSGSVAMRSAKEEDDVDLFIITAKNRIWTVRFITNFIAWVLGLKRKRGSKQARNKVCLNLFFDESSLEISNNLRSYYMAHEVLQMVPILDVNRSYRRFLLRNDWIRGYCPNVDLKRYFPFHFLSAQYICNTQFGKNSVFGDILESIFKNIQLWYMGQPQGDERITRGQLWFHPRDYGLIVNK